MLRTLLVIVLIAHPSAATAGPDRLQFPIASLHTKDEDNKFEDFNPGVFLTWDQPRASISVGVFRNSYGDGAFALAAAWPIWRPHDWDISVFGALAWYPNGSRFDLSVGNWVPGLGIEVRHEHLFAQIFPSSDDILDMVVTFGVTVPWSDLSD